MAEKTEVDLSTTEEKSGKTETEQSPTLEKVGKAETKQSLPIKKESLKKTGRPNRIETEPPKWTIRGIDVETRNIIDKAARKHGQTLGQFFNSNIREYCTGQIKKGEQPPAAPVNIKDMITAELISFKTDILESIIAASPKQDKKTFAQKLKELFQ